MQVPSLDLIAQYATIREEVNEAVTRVLESQRFILGPEVTRFEDEIAGYLGCAHAIGVSSGTDALLAALMALQIGPGDEVITTPFTFFATAGAVHRLGARPVFVDVEPRTLNLDPESVARAVTDRTRAIIPVHIFGKSADMAAILGIAASHDLSVIEDAAQSIGADLRGAQTGTLGALGCFSFFPSKNLGGIGDGGLVTCNDDGLADDVRRLRAHGSRPKYFHHVVGGNFRLDAINAAVLRVKLRHLDGWIEGRRAAARRYAELMDAAGLRGADGPVLALPPGDEGGRHVFHQYVIRAHRRDELQAHLGACGVGTAVYYPRPLHLQPCFAELRYAAGDLPHSEAASLEVLALPMYPELTRELQAHVVDTIADFYEKTG